MEVVLHVGQLAAYVETVALGYQLEAGGVAGVRSVEYLVRLGVVLEGVAHVVDERVGDTGLEVHSRRNQPVIGAVLDGVGRGIDAHALVVGIVLPSDTLAAAIDDGEEGKCLLRIEVLAVGHIVGVTVEHLVRLCHSTRLVGIHRVDTVVVSFELASQGLSEHIAGDALGYGGAVGHTHNIVFHVGHVEVACVVAHILIEVVVRRESLAVAQYHGHVVIVVGQANGLCLLAARSHRSILLDCSAIHIDGHIDITGESGAVVGLCRYSEAEVAALAGRAGEAEAQVTDSSRRLVLGFLALEEEGGELLVLVERVDECGLTGVHVNRVECFAGAGHSFPDEGARATVVAHRLHIVGRCHSGLTYHLGFARGLIDGIVVAVESYAVELSVGSGS